MAFVEAGTYVGRIERATLKKSLEKKTMFFDAVCVITEEGPHKGARVAWSGFLTDGSSDRTFRSLIDSGCTFPEDDYSNLAGLGTNDQELVVEEEEPYTPKPTEQNPNPKPIRRSRVSWINKMTSGIVGTVVEDAEKKALSNAFKGAVNRAKTGSPATGKAKDGSHVDEKGTLKDAAGKDMF